ncbi:MAG: glycosyltransferase family 2 protein [Austwickia sp.]|nr:glycosyltransferase family 2 protein [Austwickia sp.]
MSTQASPTEPAWPGISVVIPVLNEERHLASAVQMVLDQAYEGSLEVILAIGPSTDGTDAVAAELTARDPRVRTVANPTGRTPDALNAGIAASRYDVVVRVDGHAEIMPGYLATAVTELQRSGADNVGGIMDAQGISDLERAVARAMRSPLGVGNARFHVGGGAGPADTVYLGCFRKATLQRVGGYDPHFTRAQDWELNHRIRQSGGLVWFTPDLRVTYRPRGTLKALASQYFHYGRWRRVVAQRHEGTINARYLAPPAMVVGTTLATIVGLSGSRGLRGSRGQRWTRVGLAAPIGYAAAVTVGGAAISTGESWRVRRWVPVVLATMHWSWGVGFLTSPPGLRARRGARGAP